MENWQSILKDSITDPSELKYFFDIDEHKLIKVVSLYPMRINPYYLGLIKEIGDPIWCQAIPSSQELVDSTCMVDPLAEENLSPVPNLIHKYPDRVLFLVHNQCAMYCRFCTRKRKVGTSKMDVDSKTIMAGIEYVKNSPLIRDVLISGGDPLLLSNEKLEWILASLQQIPHVEIVRIGTRVPCVLPMRITKKLVAMLKRYHPLYINTHFNHPAEITEQSSLACTRLANAGIPLGCQTVLLRGVNNNETVIKKLMHSLLKIRVKPYYLFLGDMTRGTDHFRIKVEKGVQIVKSLIGHTSGLAVPHLAVDAPGGGGKIPLLPNYVQQLDTTKMIFTNYCGKSYSYINGYD